MAVSSVPLLSSDLTASGWVAMVEEPQKSCSLLTVSRKKVRVPSLVSTTVEGKMLTLIPSAWYFCLASKRAGLKYGLASKR